MALMPVARKLVQFIGYTTGAVMSCFAVNEGCSQKVVKLIADMLDFLD